MSEFINVPKLEWHPNLSIVSDSTVPYSILHNSAVDPLPPFELKADSKCTCKTKESTCNCKKNANPPMPVCITQTKKKDNFFTTVRWNDGTYTTVKVSENDKRDESPYMAFCAALAKKLYGSNAATHRIVNRHMSTYLEEQQRNQMNEQKAQEEKRRQVMHDRAVRAAARRLRINEEAIKYNALHS